MGKKTSILYNIIIVMQGCLRHRIYKKLGLQLSLLHYIQDRMGVTEGDFSLEL